MNVKSPKKSVHEGHERPSHACGSGPALPGSCARGLPILRDRRGHLEQQHGEGTGLRAKGLLSHEITGDRAACPSGAPTSRITGLQHGGWEKLPQRMHAPQQKRCGDQIRCEDRASYLCRLHPCGVLAAFSTPFMKCQ